MPLILAAALGWAYGFFLTRRRGLPVQDQIHRAFVYAMAFGLAAFMLGVLVSLLSPNAPPPSL